MRLGFRVPVAGAPWQGEHRLRADSLGRTPEPHHIQAERTEVSPDVILKDDRSLPILGKEKTSFLHSSQLKFLLWQLYYN